jgi:hypothetical protein
MFFTSSLLAAPAARPYCRWIVFFISEQRSGFFWVTAMLIGRRRCHRQSLRRVGRFRVDEKRVKVERSTYDNRRLLLLLSNARPTLSLARSPLQAQLQLSLHHLELSARGSLGLSRHARA